jgi:uncharacterized membrane protein
MNEKNKTQLSLVAINQNQYVKQLRTLGDKLADKITTIAGSTVFLVLNVVWFVAWILINTGVFGEKLIFDEYPFGFLTMVVSLEAIVLSIFVLISQNRQSKHVEIRAELDYIADLQADAETSAVIGMLARIADKQGIDMSDVLADLAKEQKKILRSHPITAKDLEE